MPRKLENGKYAFKGGCIGEKGKDGKYKLVAVRKKKIKKGKKSKKSTKSKVENEGENKGEKKVENKVENKKKRRSQKKTFKKPTQEGGNNSNLDINVRMLREFYSKNL